MKILVSALGAGRITRIYSFDCDKTRIYIREYSHPIRVVIEPGKG